MVTLLFTFLLQHFLISLNGDWSGSERNVMENLQSNNDGEVTDHIEPVGEEHQTDEEHMKAAETARYNYTPIKRREAL